MRAELKRMGLSLDWSRELATCHPGYYKYQQELFLDFFRAGLAYRGEAFVNWDPVDHTVLANEQVIDGKGWRSGAPVEKKKLSQWFLKITAYADELLEALKGLDRWPEKVRLMQENWIGKSTGAYVRIQAGGARGSADDLHHAAGYAVRRLVHGGVAGSSAGGGDGQGRSEGRAVHCRVQSRRHLGSGHRGAGEEGLSHRLSRRSIPSSRTSACRSISRTSC